MDAHKAVTIRSQALLNVLPLRKVLFLKLPDGSFLAGTAPTCRAILRHWPTQKMGKTEGTGGEGVRSHLEREGSRFRRGWGAAVSSGPSGTEVKKRRKPKTQRGRVSNARAHLSSSAPRVPCLCPQGAPSPEAKTQELLLSKHKRMPMCGGAC